MCRQPNTVGHTAAHLEAQQGSARPRAAAILGPHERLTILTAAGNRGLG